MHGLLVGAAVSAEPLRSDPLYAELLRQQANIVVAEDAMNFGPIHPHRTASLFVTQTSCSPLPPPTACACADTASFRIASCSFVRQLRESRQRRQVFTNHIETVAGRYVGRVHSWDVVNEAIQIADGSPTISVARPGSSCSVSATSTSPSATLAIGRAQPADISRRNQAIAQAYTTYLEPLLRNPDVVALLTSGITDRYTSRNSAEARPVKLPARALPFDLDLRPKLAYVAEVQAIQGRPTQR